MHVYDLNRELKIAVRIVKAKKSDLRDITEFEFDWMVESDYEVYKLETKRSGEVLGLISLKVITEELRIEIRLLEIRKDDVGRFKRYQGSAGILIGFACKKAFDLGFFGFVSLIPKTNLIEHYKDKCGFKQFGRHMAVQLIDSEMIMNKYLTNE